MMYDAAPLYNTSTWTERIATNSGPIERAGHTAVVMSDVWMYVLGGVGSDMVAYMRMCV